MSSKSTNINLEFIKRLKKESGYTEQPEPEFQEEIVNDFVLDDAEVKTEKYYYNKLDDKYVFYLKSIGKHFILSGDKVKNIFRSYSNIFGDPATINEIARQLCIPRNATQELIRSLSLTHGTTPVTPHELAYEEEEQIVEDIGEYKKFKIAQELEKKVWRDTQKEALRWREYEFNNISPVERFLEGWTPPKAAEIKPVFTEGEHTLLSVLQDTHICELTKAVEVFSGNEYNTEKAIGNVRNYLAQIKARLSTRKIGFTNGVLLLNGDLVHATIDEFTRRGTKLKCEYINEEAFKIVLDLIIEVIAEFSSWFKNTRVICNKGNHCSVLSSYIVMGAEKYFMGQDNIEFEIFSNWINSFRINNVFCVATHGVSDTIKNVGLPGSALKLKSYIQELLIQKPGNLIECPERICIAGHKHSQYIEDFGSFKMYRFGSTVNADSFGEALGFFNRPSQSCLVLGKSDVQEVWNFYLD